MWLRLEAAGRLALILPLYENMDGSWPAFALLFLVPDVGMLGLPRRRPDRAGGYNLFHTSTLPIVPAVYGIITETNWRRAWR
jgi:hypothetical protein